MANEKHNPQCAEQLAASSPDEQTVVNTVCVGMLSFLAHTAAHSCAHTCYHSTSRQAIISYADQVHQANLTCIKHFIAYIPNDGYFLT